MVSTQHKATGPATLATVSKGRRITGATRVALAEKLARQYKKGTSIRTLAESSGRSYGFIHRILAESGVEMRPRGGRQAKAGSTSLTPARAGK